MSDERILIASKQPLSIEQIETLAVHVRSHQQWDAYLCYQYEWECAMYPDA